MSSDHESTSSFIPQGVYRKYKHAHNNNTVVAPTHTIRLHESHWTYTEIKSVIIISLHPWCIHSDQELESKVSTVIIAAGSASGVAIICIILLALIVVALVYLKRRKNTFCFTSNVAYTGHCIEDDDVDYYSVSQPAPQNRSVTYRNEMKDDSLATDHIAASKSSYCTGIYIKYARLWIMLALS